MGGSRWAFTSTFTDAGITNELGNLLTEGYNEV